MSQCVSGIELSSFWGAVHAGGRLKSSDWVAITAASSSVGLAAIQIARQLGAHPITVTLTGQKREALLAAGAEAVISTSDECLQERLGMSSRHEPLVAFNAV